MVARCIEAFPDVVAHLLGHGSDFFPAALQGNNGLRRGFPVGTVLEFFCLLNKFFLQFQVLAETVTDCTEVFGLTLEELVASLTEAFENADIHLLRSKANGLPLLLKGDDGFGL